MLQLCLLVHGSLRSIVFETIDILISFTDALTEYL